MKKATKKEAIELMRSKLEKYELLVWLARKSPEDYKMPGVMKLVRKAEGKYKQECMELGDPELGNWSHGFNSGMLACLRYVLTAMEEDIEFAEENFPFLDT